MAKIHTHIGSEKEEEKYTVVTCFSMNNGLYGSPREAIVTWNQIDLTEPDAYRHGKPTSLQTVSLPIKNQIEHFGVLETKNHSALLVGQSDINIVYLYFINGPRDKNDNSTEKIFTFYAGVK